MSNWYPNQSSYRPAPRTERPVLKAFVGAAVVGAILQGSFWVGNHISGGPDGDEFFNRHHQPNIVAAPERDAQQAIQWLETFKEFMS